ncbi:MAG TPA: hypothetical protein VHS03_02890 [Gaiellaceae bacterium]|nr:hypothetical protein [Gaiellaceae bacterium]
MLASINPLGERGRNQRYALTVAAHVAGSTAAGALLGAALGAVGSSFATPAVAFTGLLVVLVGGLALDAAVARARPSGIRVPGPRRQVNEDWLATYRGWVYGAGFGAQLGAGFATVVVGSITWVVFATALLSGSSLAGALVGATFGMARGLSILLAAPARDSASLSALFRRLERARPRVTRAGIVGQAAASVVLLAALTSRIA